MANALAKVAHQLVVIAVYQLSVLRALFNCSSSKILRVCDTQYSRPLLKLLISSLRANKAISQTVRNQESRTLSSVSGIRVLHERAPLVGSVSKSLSTGLVGTERRGVALGSSEARERDARVRSTGLEDIGVGSDHNVGHHGARGTAHDENLGFVAVVLLQRVVDHADYAEGIAVAAVREGSCVVHVPAVGVLGRLGVDQDKSLAFRVGGELGAAVPLRSRAAAGVELETKYE